MFSFALPRYAAFKVALPTGGETVFIHLGGGKFVTRVPPVALHAVVPAGVEFDPEPVPLTWDTELAGDVVGNKVVFDLASAEKSVGVAAGLGDALAVEYIGMLEEAGRALDMAAAESAASHVSAGGLVGVDGLPLQ